MASPVLKPTPTPTPPVVRPTLSGHLAIMRMDHWVKNVFVLPGILIPLVVDPAHWDSHLLLRIVIGFASVCLITSSNYVINEVLDAPFDRFHPLKSQRPVPSGKVSIPLAYVQWLALMVVGLALAYTVSIPFLLTMAALWVMGCAYNIPPIRTKDVPYLDVLSESVNNPLRMLAGWFITGTPLIPPASLLCSYWMIGCYFMALKRYAEYRDLGDAKVASLYRKSFAFYTEERLLASVLFYSSAAMLFFGAFIMRYRMELILAIPLIALVMALYLDLSFRPNSSVQRPEGLYRERSLMLAVFACAVVMIALFLVDIQWVRSIFAPTIPTQASVGTFSTR